jgi:hypothetical protein
MKHGVSPQIGYLSATTYFYASPDKYPRSAHLVWGFIGRADNWDFFVFNGTVGGDW